MRFVRVVAATRYMVLIPILGLAIAAAAMFVFGGLGLIGFVIDSVKAGMSRGGHGLAIFDLLEYVHQFLIGTVLYITAMGLFQLFIEDVPVPHCMKTESAEDLETNLIGVTVVVLAIEFLGFVFSGKEGNLLEYGAESLYRSQLWRCSSALGASDIQGAWCAPRTPIHHDGSRDGDVYLAR